MRRYALIVCVCLFLGTAGAWGRTMKHVLVQMPQEVLPLLSTDNLLDAVDFRDSGMYAAVKNRMGETSVLAVLTDEYARWELSAASRAEMKLLSGGRDTVVCLVHTCLTPEPMSTVAFYTLDWRPLPASRFVRVPGADAFLRPELTKDEGRAVLDGLETALVEARLSADADTLDFILHADGGDPERRQEQAAWLTERVSCQWQGRRFVRK